MENSSDFVPNQEAEPKRLNVIMPQPEYRKLKQFALDHDMTISDVVRAALQAHTRRKEFEVIGDSAGEPPAI